MTCTETVFLEGVKNHEMTALLDVGIYRHLRFASKEKEGACSQWFEIVTWPGFLAYSGDMGCFVFARLKDMFEFFRVRPADEKATLHINLGYWAEKLAAVDRTGCAPGARAYSEQRFKELVETQVTEWIRENGLAVEEQEQLRNAIESDVLGFADDGEREAHEALRDFRVGVSGNTFEFSDTWEWDLKEYTFRFVWCCYALAWAIRQYDAEKLKGVELRADG